MEVILLSVKKTVAGRTVMYMELCMDVNAGMHVPDNVLVVEVNTADVGESPICCSTFAPVSGAAC